MSEVLTVLREAGMADAGELSRRLHETRSWVNAQLRQLEDGGRVRRVGRTGDGITWAVVARVESDHRLDAAVLAALDELYEPADVATIAAAVKRTEQATRASLRRLRSRGVARMVGGGLWA